VHTPGCCWNLRSSKRRKWNPGRRNAAEHGRTERYAEEMAWKDKNIWRESSGWKRRWGFFFSGYRVIVFVACISIQYSRHLIDYECQTFVLVHREVLNWPDEPVLILASNHWTSLILVCIPSIEIYHTRNGNLPLIYGFFEHSIIYRKRKVIRFGETMTGAPLWKTLKQKIIIRSSLTPRSQWCSALPIMTRNMESIG